MDALNRWGVSNDDSVWLGMGEISVFPGRCDLIIWREEQEGHNYFPGNGLTVLFRQRKQRPLVNTA
jgi:hypothetical protein